MTEQENLYSSEERKIFLKERYFTGSHNYFFELKEAKNGSKYIVVDQRKKVGDQFVSAKMRIFEDEMLEFERILHKFINLALNNNKTEEFIIQESNNNLTSSNSDLTPAFFTKLSSTNNWKDFEEYTYYILKLLGLPVIYSFLNERQAGKADGFFKIGNLAVIYDCTLNARDIENHKNEQIHNYCNRLQQGNIELSGNITEEFFNHNKQVWIITQGITRQIKVVNSIEVKEISIEDIMVLYQERLIKSLNDQSLELKLRNL